MSLKGVGRGKDELQHKGLGPACGLSVCLLTPTDRDSWLPLLLDRIKTAL